MNQAAGLSAQLDGLRAQLERTEKFRDSLNIEGAIETYRRLLGLLYPNLEQLRVDAGLPPTPSVAAAGRAMVAAVSRSAALTSRQMSDPPVYSFWDSPLEEAPPIVQACMDQLLKVYPGAQVLDVAAVHSLIDVPPSVGALLDQGRPAHYSDYIRTRILEEYGGVWADATVWLPGPLPAGPRSVLRADTVFPRYSGSYIANWFIASRAQSPILALQRRALDAWWGTYTDLPDYFLYHRIFETLSFLVPEFRGRWYAAPRISATSSRLLQLEMMQPYDPQRLRWIMNAAPMQKLSYKYDDVLPGSVLEHLLGGRQ
ncbi:capsular polysaccharide synthesis protein [Kocuria sp.]|uniref:capsular polysaccharide synthesis protein n=1 Tax=Kocuria sp. TaxID=1871328 RepID=UPI0026E03BF5|nr:capsular polysaccharide synthesis protein [Kocuria sp.]MDO5619251.1 capsular polysaccharide synthesis protein [Kocuria sp.]